MIHEATLYEKLPTGKLKCTACRRYCFLADGQTGFCGVRKNDGGRLDLIAYGRPLATHVDPIEKKPILHLNQGSWIYSLGTAGCDFACKFCQNYEVSQRRNLEGSKHMTPAQVVDSAIDQGCQGIAFTYNEPTIFTEYARDIGMLAKDRGLFTIFVSNGYETPESIKELSGFLDCITVDFKGNANKDFYRKYMSVPSPEFIFDTLRELSASRIHVEITDLVVPEVGDSIDDARTMIRKVRDILGESVPISFLRFHPDFRMLEFPPTSSESLLLHYEAAREEGMKYVYIGNVPGSRYQNTYCPDCGHLCVERDMMRTVSFNLTSEGKCPECGYDVGILPLPDKGMHQGGRAWWPFQ